jgi:hypothetical protein
MIFMIVLKGSLVMGTYPITACALMISNVTA